MMSNTGPILVFPRFVRGIHLWPWSVCTSWRAIHGSRTGCGRLRVLEQSGFTPRSWRALARRARPPLRDVLGCEPCGQQRGWQHEAASHVDLRFMDEDLFHRVPAPVRALIRSQGGPMAGMALSTSPTSHLTRLQPHLFRTILLRRFRQLLPLSERSAGWPST